MPRGEYPNALRERQGPATERGISTGVGKPSTLTQAKRDRLIGRLEKAGAKIDAFVASDEGRALIDRVTARRKGAK